MLQVIAKFQTSLSSGISDSATELTLVSNASSDGDGETLPNGQYGFVLDEENSSREYILGTVDGITVTIDARGISVIDGETEKDTNKHSHRKGASIKITDHPILTSMVEAFNGNTALGGVLLLPADRVISNQRHIVDKEYVDSREGYWEGAVANYAALPTGENDGEARVTLDDSKIYVWDEGTTSWVLAGAGGGSGTVYIDTFLGSDADASDHRTFILTSGSFQDDKYLQVYLNGVLMEIGASEDYTTSGNNTSVFNYDINDADKVTMLVVSVDLYNPDWNDVNSDVLPDITNSYDLGSDSLRFKDIYLEGDADIDGDVDIEGALAIGGALTVGGTGEFTGQVTIPETPVADTDAASKGYVDANTEKESISSSTLRTSDDTVENLTGTLTKFKEIVFNNPSGVVSTTFDLSEGGSGTATGQIYINGVPAGTNHGTTTTDTFVEDIGVSEGDLVQLYGRSAQGGTLSNFRLSYDVVVKHIGDTVN